MKYLLFLVFCALAGSVSATEVERLLNEYRQIKTLTCQIRRTVSGQQGDIQFMSRVYWQNDDRFHAENLTPISRRIISDGTRFYSYAEGDSKGFSRPVNDLSERMLLSLRQIPGTPMDNLLRLVKYEEQILEPIDGLRRTAYRTEKQYVICQFDGTNRLVQIDFLDADNHAVKNASYRYSKYSEVLPGTWVPMHHDAEIRVDHAKSRETVKVDRFIVNQPVAESLFNPKAFFDKEVDFVATFEEIYPHWCPVKV